MYAVVRTGGKQYAVKVGDTLKVEKLTAEAGSAIELADVLAVGEGESLKIGTPVIKDAKVVCEIVAHGKGKKVLVFKKKRRTGYTKKQGHRQDFTSLKVKEIRA